MCSGLHWGDRDLSQMSEDATVNDDRYGSDVLAGDWRKSHRETPSAVEAVRDLVVEDAASGFCGAITRLDGKLIELEDYSGVRRVFPRDNAFLIDGKSIRLVRPIASGLSRTRTASGSFAAPSERARVARSSRILVEGRHDAELVEKIWGDDLRHEGVVVEYLEGVDNLETIVDAFTPEPARRLGVLVDHLVPGSKETRIAKKVAHGRYGEHVLILGHPYIDVWEAIKPERVGLSNWPVVPRGIEWKHGACEALGMPRESQADISRTWKFILGRVTNYSDIEPALLGRIEELIDFVTAGKQPN